MLMSLRTGAQTLDGRSAAASPKGLAKTHVLNLNPEHPALKPQA